MKTFITIIVLVLGTAFAVFNFNNEIEKKVNSVQTLGKSYEKRIKNSYDEVNRKFNTVKNAFEG